MVDPYQAGYYDFHGNPQKDGGVGANVAPKSKSDHEEMGIPENAPTLAVPGDWNMQRPEFYLYEGTMWYKREFDCVARPGRRQFLWFGAANYRAIAFLNGQKVGEHEGGFTPFQFEVTGKLKERGNAADRDGGRHAPRRRRSANHDRLVELRRPDARRPPAGRARNLHRGLLHPTGEGLRRPHRSVGARQWSAQGTGGDHTHRRGRRERSRRRPARTARRA